MNVLKSRSHSSDLLLVAVIVIIALVSRLVACRAGHVMACHGDASRGSDRLDDGKSVLALSPHNETDGNRDDDGHKDDSTCGSTCVSTHTHKHTHAHTMRVNQNLASTLGMSWRDGARVPATTPRAPLLSPSASSIDNAAELLFVKSMD